MSLRTEVGLSGLAPKKYTEIRTVYSGKNTYMCFFNRDDKTNTATFIKGVQIVVDKDCREVLTKLIPNMTDEIQALLDDEDWDV